MRIVFVRHGQPDYEKDCLTELGHIQAEAVGKRLLGEKPSRLYASTMGRATETAEHIAPYTSSFYGSDNSYDERKIRRAHFSEI